MSFAPKSLALKSLTNFAPNSPFLFCAEKSCAEKSGHASNIQVLDLNIQARRFVENTDFAL